MMKTQITKGVYEMQAAAIYEDSRLPDIYSAGQLAFDVTADEGLSETDAGNLNKGFIKTILPYTLRDNYDRVLKPRKFISVTMENEYLRAVILPEIGGRVWSLYDKRRGKELVFKNPVFQPCNFGLRNAWAAGGIEFNIGMTGHCVHTSDTIFCTINKYKNGSETVKVYEYERIRGVAWSVELLMPDGADSLFARVTVENTSREQKYMYWWTNIAVTEEKGQRMLTPCEKVFVKRYEDGAHLLGIRDVAGESNAAALYPEKNPRTIDYFYKIPEERSKWIVSADGGGYGLAYTSTDLLKGRKLFAWGTNNGGRNWSQFLSDKGLYYAEIQGGLAYHQFEHIVMPPETDWQWVEAYTPFQGNGLIHSPDVYAAQNEAEKSLKMSGAEIKKRNVYEGLTPENAEATEYVTLGSGWGYIENLLRTKRGKASISKNCAFGKSSVSDIESGWLRLIENGAFPSEDVTEPPKSFMVGRDIIEMLEKAAANGGGAYTHLQLGVALFAAEKHDEALAAWEKSMEIRQNAWAARNIAMLKRHYGDYDAACFYMRRAITLNPSYRPLLIDCAKLFVEAKMYGDWVGIYEKISPDLKKAGRIKYLTALAYIRLGMRAEAEGLVNGDLVIEDLREGDLSIEKIWDELYGDEYPLPKALDFRMNIKGAV